MNKSALKGRNWILIISLSSILLSLGATIFYNTVIDSSRLLNQMIRFTVNCILLSFLLLGYNWSKWLNLIFFLAGGISGTIAGIDRFSETPSLGLYVIFLGIFYFTAGGLVILNKNVNEYINYRTRLRKHAPPL